MKEIIRIILTIVGGFLFGYGIGPKDFGTPSHIIMMIIGVLIVLWTCPVDFWPWRKEV